MGAVAPWQGMAGGDRGGRRAGTGGAGATGTAHAAPQADTAAQGESVYSDARFDALRAEGKTVFVNFTADWCITCKVNERTTLSRERVQQAFRDHDVTYLKGDWTRSDPAITRVLERYQRSGVPLYLVSVKGSTPQVLPQTLTPDIVISAVSAPPAAP